jgi:hypothetical protein
MKKTKIIAVIAYGIALSGCTSMKVTPLNSQINKDVCIEHNEKVKVNGFQEIIRNGFEERGFKTRVFTGEIPESCSTILTYTATRKWDLAPYMTDAEIWLRDKNGSRVGYAQYHLKGGGGLALNKWASAESKMARVINELLSAYPK